MVLQASVGTEINVGQDIVVASRASPDGELCG